MELRPLHLDGAIVIVPRVFGDARGYFFEPFNLKAFGDKGLPTTFVQDNESRSSRGTFRGLHLQAPPHGQGKLVRVAQGAALDLIVDIRTGSPTYGQHAAVELSAANHHLLWVPEGFAHGFLTLEDDTVFCYKCTGYYHVQSELGLSILDPALGITLPFAPTAFSDKDKALPALADFASPYAYKPGKEGRPGSAVPAPGWYGVEV